MFFSKSNYSESRELIALIQQWQVELIKDSKINKKNKNIIGKIKIKWQKYEIVSHTEDLYPRNSLYRKIIRSTRNVIIVLTFVNLITFLLALNNFSHILQH